MKTLKFLSPIPFILFIIASFFPFVEHTKTFNETTSITTERGIDFGMIILPMGIMLFILLVANIKRTRFTAIIGFVLCFGLIFSLFLMQFVMQPVSSYTVIHSFQIGYFLALSSALLLMTILLVNLVKTFLNHAKSTEYKT